MNAHNAHRWPPAGHTARWEPGGLALGLLALTFLAALTLYVTDVDVSSDAAAADQGPTPREVQLRESALYDCLRTVPPHRTLAQAFDACGLEYSRAQRPAHLEGGAP